MYTYNILSFYLFNFVTDDIDVICNRFIIPAVGEDWRFLAREIFPSLDQADNAIHDIAYVCRGANPKEKVKCVITRWQHECAQEASFSVLLCALNHMVRKDIIQKLNVGKCI